MGGPGYSTRHPAGNRRSNHRMEDGEQRRRKEHCLSPFEGCDGVHVVVSGICQENGDLAGNRVHAYP